MDLSWELAIDLGIIAVLILGIWLFRTVRGARAGNLAAALALACALAAVLYRHPTLAPAVAFGALAAGGLAGWAVAARVNMIQIPAVVAFQHGAGGVAAMLVAFVELTRDTDALSAVGRASGILGIVVGTATFSGSMIASGKLAGRLRQTPTVLPKHGWLLAASALGVAVAGALAGTAGGAALTAVLLALVLLSALVGLVFSVRVGGADMPVLISFLNATAGLAAAFCGVVLQNRLLIACGATVAASGSILTHCMCRAMNRRLVRVLVGTAPSMAAPRQESRAQPAAPASESSPNGTAPAPPLQRALEALRRAETVVFIPGYGMAQAHAQFETVRLANRLVALGKAVRFAIHPIAGRMPGHMHVLLAEADVDPDMLLDMDEANPQMPGTDLALVVGACDVVNPAATTAENTPIAGMPILAAHEAAQVLVCNLDARPGYSGVENSLYAEPKTILLLGDAKESLGRLLGGLD